MCVQAKQLPKRKLKATRLWKRGQEIRPFWHRKCYWCHFVNKKTKQKKKKKEPQRKKAYIRTCAPSEDSDQIACSAQSDQNLHWALLDSTGCRVSSCGQWRLWSDCVDAQADLSLRWAHTSECTFSNVAAYFIGRYEIGYNKVHLSTDC